MRAWHNGTEPPVMLHYGVKPGRDVIIPRD